MVKTAKQRTIHNPMYPLGINGYGWTIPYKLVMVLGKSSKFYNVGCKPRLSTGGYRRISGLVRDDKPVVKQLTNSMAHGSTWVRAPLSKWLKKNN